MKLEVLQANDGDCLLLECDIMRWLRAGIEMLV